MTHTKQGRPLNWLNLDFPDGFRMLISHDGLWKLEQSQETWQVSHRLEKSWEPWITSSDRLADVQAQVEEVAVYDTCRVCNRLLVSWKREWAYKQLSRQTCGPLCQMSLEQAR